MTAIRLIHLSGLFLVLTCSSGEPPAPAADIEVAFPKLSFNRPVDLQHCGDNRLFVVEQAGRILAFPNHPNVSAVTVFLDIQTLVEDDGNEEGLLGLAFHPQFGSNGYFYVNYTATSPDRTVIARYKASPADSNTADPSSALVLLEFSQPYSNHNGGQLGFGPDGYLYIAVGDGGSGGDPQNHAQNLNSLLGKILRIDVNNPSDGRNYGIPPDNPFAGTSSRGEIFAYGLRNPWRFSFDPVTGNLWTGDVGQNEIEEIDIIEKGKNYGWRIMEGNQCYNPSNCSSDGLELPIWQYYHWSGQSITGGHVYRGTRVKTLIGAYLYADFVSGRVWALRASGSAVESNTELFRKNIPFSSFGVDRDNELYLCAFDGKIYRFRN